MTTATTPKKNVSQDPTITKVVDLMQSIMSKGLPLYLSRGLKKEHMDVLYTMAYNLYSQEKYEEAFPLFQSLTFYNNLDQKGWLGAAGCCEMLQRYEQALTGYSYAAVLNLDDPLPPLHAVDCYIALKNYPEALSALEAVILLSSKKPEYQDLKKRAEMMRDTLQETIDESKNS